MRLDRKTSIPQDLAHPDLPAHTAGRRGSLELSHAPCTHSEEGSPKTCQDSPAKDVIPYPRLRRPSLDCGTHRPKLLSPLNPSVPYKSFGEGSKNKAVKSSKESPKSNHEKRKKIRGRLRSPPPKPTNFLVDDEEGRISGSQEDCTDGQPGNLEDSRKDDVYNVPNTNLPPLEMRARSKSIDLSVRRRRQAADVGDHGSGVFGSYPPRSSFLAEASQKILNARDNDDDDVTSGCSSPVSLCRIPLRICSPAHLVSILKPVTTSSPSSRHSQRRTKHRHVTFNDDPACNILSHRDSISQESSFLIPESGSSTSYNNGSRRDDELVGDNDNETWFQEMARQTGRRNSLPPLQLTTGSVPAQESEQQEEEKDTQRVDNDDQGVICEVVHSFTPRKRTRPR